MSQQPPPVPPRPPTTLDAQESVPYSEDWPSEEEADYDNYYGEEDLDVTATDDSQPQDAAFQSDPEHYKFSCLSTEETWNFLDSQAREASREIKLDVCSSRILLHHLNWDTKELVKRFFTNNEELMESAHLKMKEEVSAIALVRECPVCLQPGAAGTLHSLPCGHTFCANCCVEHILSKLKAGVTSAMECLQCPGRVGLELVQSILEARAQDSARFLHYILSDYVQSHPYLRWCPGPSCSIVFCVSDPKPKKVSCSKCFTSCCFVCGEAYHCPTDCESIKVWLTKCQDDSETANYIMANTKDCPSCHTSIEKNGGCNHMSCTKCHADFCWMCLGSWKSHNGYFNCSKYKDKGDGEEVTSARKALEKYLFYYQRWANHDQSLKLEEQTKQKIVDRVEQKVLEGSGTWIDWQYLMDAVGLLKKCRYTLKYTYPFAYFLGGDRKPLFEYQQAQLEVEIENLSWKVERAESTHVAELRQQMNSAEVMRLTLLRDFVE